MLLATTVLACGLLLSGSGGASTRGSDPLAARPFYVQKGSAAAYYEGVYRRAGNSGDAKLLARIASQPQALWLTTWQSVRWLRIALAQDRRQRRLLTFVLYFIPGRDCGSYSSGGAKSATEYRKWVREIAARLGGIPTAAIIEPDALAEITCWGRAQQNTAYSLIRYASRTLAARPRTSVYIDAGNEVWKPAATMVARLRRAGVASARGFSLNVSSFVSTAKTIAYGTRIARALGGKHFVIDTGRNGRGGYWHDGVMQWCNPPGRGLGADPTTHTASPLVDAYLWIKTPGGSDGPCNGGPPAGGWWPAYALGLAARAQR